MPMAMRRAMMMMRRRRRRAAAAASSQQAAAAGAEEEDNDPLADIADMLHVQYGEEATDEELKAAVKASIDQLWVHHRVNREGSFVNG